MKSESPKGGLKGESISFQKEGEKEEKEREGGRGKKEGEPTAKPFGSSYPHGLKNIII